MVLGRVIAFVTAMGSILITGIENDSLKLRRPADQKPTAAGGTVPFFGSRGMDFGEYNLVMF
jgi:hypothetical protein